MDNAASRLLAILEAGSKISSETPCNAAWQSLLGASNNDELLPRLGDFLRMVGDASDDILRTHPDENDAVSHWRSRVLNGFYQAGLGHHWSTFYKNIDSAALFSLRSHAKILNYDKPAKEIPPETLTEIREHLQKALDALSGLSISLDFKKLIAYRIDQLISLVNRYHIFGGAELLDSGKLLISDIALLPEEARKTVKQSSAFESIKEGLSVLSDAVSVSSALPQISTAVSNLLKALT